MAELRIILQRFKVLFLLIFFLCSAHGVLAASPFVWGVNGHPFSAYPGVSPAQQIKLVGGLGMTSYRVNISYDTDAEKLAGLLEIAGKSKISILPVLTPALDLKKETPEDLYSKARMFAIRFASRFKGQIRVWELGNEMENFAILQPCEIQEDGKQYNCKWGAASGTKVLDYHGDRWKRVSAVLKGLSDGLIFVDPGLKKAMGTAGWGHVAAFERMKRDGIKWDISVWHVYRQDIDWGLRHVASFGKPIWITEFNHPLGSQKGIMAQAAGLGKLVRYIHSVAQKYKVQAAFVYELLDESYWKPDFEAYMGLIYLKKNARHKWQTAGPKPAYCVVSNLLQGGYQTGAALSPRQDTGGKALKPQRQCNLCLFDQKDASAGNKIKYSYCLMLGRNADGAGLASWNEALGKGSGVKGSGIVDILLGLSRSGEFEKTHATAKLDHGDFVTFIYRLLANRDPDGQGYKDFVQALKLKKTSRSGFIRSMLMSSEFRQKHAVLFAQPEQEAPPPKSVKSK